MGLTPTELDELTGILQELPMLLRMALESDVMVEQTEHDITKLAQGLLQTEDSDLHDASLLGMLLFS